MNTRNQSKNTKYRNARSRKNKRNDKQRLLLVVDIELHMSYHIACGFDIDFLCYFGFQIVAKLDWTWLDMETGVEISQAPFLSVPFSAIRNLDEIQVLHAWRPGPWWRI